MVYLQLIPIILFSISTENKDFFLPVFMFVIKYIIFWQLMFRHNLLSSLPTWHGNQPIILMEFIFWNVIGRWVMEINSPCENHWGNKRFSNTIFIPHAICNTISCCIMENVFQILEILYNHFEALFHGDSIFGIFLSSFYGPLCRLLRGKDYWKTTAFLTNIGLLYSNCW